jgi:acetyl-CoA carboxylase biotin carboxylase subunit
MAVGRILIANRGAVAARIIRAAHAQGLHAIAVYSEADRALPYLAAADEAHPLGPSPPRQSYLDQDRLLAVAHAARADAVHPGYGFLSENAGFARRVIAAGMAFIGPAPDLIEAMGEKTRARALMAAHGLPVARGSGVLADANAAAHAASAIGYPVLVKPAGGGGGIGMLAARDEAGLRGAVERAGTMAARSFGNASVYLEKLIERPRHIEFQMLGDRHGGMAHLFERDCSVQRRHQKVIEEAPAPGLDRGGLDALAAQAAEVLRGLGYDSIGTVEMLRGADGVFSFLEMNTRLQVEHAVTEMVTGIDLVAAQIRLADGARVGDIVGDARPAGHAIEARIYAEDPHTFYPSPGTLRHFVLPAPGDGVRVETGYAQGCTVTPFYDPLLAKVIAHAPTRDAAILRLSEALAATEIEGVKSNIPFVQRMLADPEFRAGDVHTQMAANGQK